MQSTAKKLFREAGVYFEIIDAITPVALRHEYSFMRDDVFNKLKESKDFSVSAFNQILALELVDKAHLAAMSALIRTKRWADAICLMHEANNLLGWASSARGLLESAGDIVDGLLNVVPVLAGHHRPIASGLSGRASTQVYDFSETEPLLDHYVLAKWMRVKSGERSVLKAKENATYVGHIENVLPGALKFYQRMCGIAHPSSASIEYLYDYDVAAGGRLKLTTTNDAKAIAEICKEFPEALPVSLMMSCNPALMILRVLHKFDIHPKLVALKKLHWAGIKGWPGIEKHLKN